MTTMDAVAARLYAALDAVNTATERDANGVITDEYFAARVELAAAREAYDDALAARNTAFVQTITKG